VSGILMVRVFALRTIRIPDTMDDTWREITETRSRALSGDD